MKVVVAFCGGCKSEIIRKQLLERIKSQMPETQFDFSLPKNKNDYQILVINGCPTACRTKDFEGLSKSIISVRGHMIGNTVVNEEELASKVIMELKNNRV